MPENLYTYAVARIRSKELSLLNNQFLDQLLASKTYEEAVQRGACLQSLYRQGSLFGR